MTGGAAVAVAHAGSSATEPASASRGSGSARATDIPGDPLLGLAQDLTGRLLATTVDITSDSRRSAALTRVPARGGRGRTTAIIRRPTGAARVFDVLSAVSPVGAVAAASIRSGGRSHRAALEVTTVRPDGLRTYRERLQGLATGASPFALAMGPTGAVGLITLAPGADGAATATFSFRPAGAARFAAAVALPGASVPSADGSENSDLAGSQLQVVMAPDGGAAIVDGLASSLRRVTPTGALGAEVRLDPQGASATVASFRSDGALVAASTRPIESATKTIDSQSYSSQVSLGEWPAAATAPTVRPLPLRPGQVEANDDLSISVGPDDRTTLTLADGDDRLAVLAGPGTAVEPVGRVRAPRAYDARAFPGADGSVTLLWARDVDGVTGAPVADAALLSAKAGPGGSFGKPRTLRTSSQGSVEIQATLPLADGRLAIAYTRSAGKTSLFIARP